ncbi:hypothetical protein BN1213_03200 [Mycobacterium tuberculosis]|nr:hypothetical protein BN1213_03200 [Mycobacterium tuberculosis]
MSMRPPAPAPRPPQDTGICSSSCGNSCRSSGSGSSASVMFAPNGNNYPSAPWVPGGPILPWMPELPPGDPPAPPAPPLPPSACRYRYWSTVLAGRRETLGEPRPDILRAHGGRATAMGINSCLGIVCGVLRPAWRAIGAHQRTPTVRRPASPAMSSRWFGSSRWAHCRSPRPCRPARRNSPLRRGGCRRTAGRSNRCCTSKSACPPWPCANRT